MNDNYNLSLEALPDNASINDDEDDECSFLTSIASTGIITGILGIACSSDIADGESTGELGVDKGLISLSFDLSPDDDDDKELRRLPLPPMDDEFC